MERRTLAHTLVDASLPLLRKDDEHPAAASRNSRRTRTHSPQRSGQRLGDRKSEEIVGTIAIRRELCLCIFLDFEKQPEIAPSSFGVAAGDRRGGSVADRAPAFHALELEFEKSAGM